MDVLNSASFVGNVTKATVELTFFEVKILKIFATALPLGLVTLKLRSWLELGGIR